MERNANLSPAVKRKAAQNVAYYIRQEPPPAGSKKHKTGTTKHVFTLLGVDYHTSGTAADALNKVTEEGDLEKMPAGTIKSLRMAGTLFSKSHLQEFYRLHTQEGKPDPYRWKFEQKEKGTQPTTTEAITPTTTTAGGNEILERIGGLERGLEAVKALLTQILQKLVPRPALVPTATNESKPAATDESEPAPAVSAEPSGLTSLDRWGRNGEECCRAVTEEWNIFKTEAPAQQEASTSILLTKYPMFTKKGNRKIPRALPVEKFLRIVWGFRKAVGNSFLDQLAVGSGISAHAIAQRIVRAHDGAPDKGTPPRVYTALLVDLDQTASQALQGARRVTSNHPRRG